MAVALTIAGVDQTVRIHFVTSAGFTLPLNGQRGSSRFRLEALVGDSYVPAIGQKVIWNDNGITAFEGTVDSFDTVPISDTGGYWYDVTCVSLEQLLDKLFITRAWDATGSPLTFPTAGFIVTDIMGNEAGAEGITLGTIAAGIQFTAPKGYDHVRITDVFNDLCQLSGDYIFYILDGKLNFGPSTTLPAPFGITDNSGDILITQQADALYSRTDYRNRQTVKIGEQNLAPNVESFGGDGFTSAFQLSRVIRDVVSITRTTATLPVTGPAVGTFTGVPAFNDTITIAGQKYTFRDPTSAAFNDGTVNFFLGISVNPGDSAVAAAFNLAAAVVGLPAGGLGRPGIDYSLLATANPYATASATGPVITVTPTAPGALAAFFVGLNSTCSVFSWAPYNQTTAANGSSTPQSVAEASASNATTAQWIYSAYGTTVYQNPGETPLSSLETLVVTYHPIGFGFVTVQNTVEIAARKAIEGGSGVYENLQQRLDLLTILDGAAAAQAILDSYDFIANTVTFNLDHVGLRPGQIVSLVSTFLNINGNFLVQAVTAATKLTDIVGSSYGLRYTITAVAIAP